MKRVVFLLGSMGSGKSSLLAMANPIKQEGFVLKCQEFGVLGKTLQGADSLSSHKKEEVINSLKNYNGVIVAASQYYSKKIDVIRFHNLGYEQICVFLIVSRSEVYRRVLKRGGGSWNEKTYETNLKSNISFYKNFPYKKTFLHNETHEQLQQNFHKLVKLCAY